MSKQATGSLLQEFLDSGVYKRSQGKYTRQATFVTLIVVIVLAAWRLGDFLLAYSESPYVRYGIPGVLLVVGVWVSFRVVNITRFADFLIAVEAEMNKVTWPTRTELVRSSMVVMIVIFALAAVLFSYDLIWSWLFRFIGVLHSADTPDG